MAQRYSTYPKNFSKENLLYHFPDIKKRFEQYSTITKTKLYDSATYPVVLMIEDAKKIYRENFIAKKYSIMDLMWNVVLLTNSHDELVAVGPSIFSYDSYFQNVDMISTGPVLIKESRFLPVGKNFVEYYEEQLSGNERLEHLFYTRNLHNYVNKEDQELIYKKLGWLKKNKPDWYLKLASMLVYHNYTQSMKDLEVPLLKIFQFDNDGVGKCAGMRNSIISEHSLDPVHGYDTANAIVEKTLDKMRDVYLLNLPQYEDYTEKQQDYISDDLDEECIILDLIDNLTTSCI